MSFDLKHIAQPQAAFSPQHKKLNRLIDQIEQQKIELSKWQNSQAEIQQHVRQKLLPIYSELHQILFAQLERLWANVQSDEFSKAEQQLLDEKTAELAKILKKICGKDLHSPKVCHTFAPHLRTMLGNRKRYQSLLEGWVSG